MEREYCYRHSDRETGRHCTRCEKPACPECLVQASVGSHCLDCVKEQRAGHTQFVVKRSVARPDLITVILVALNVAVFLYQEIAGDGSFVSRFALWGPAVAHGEPYLIVTSGFLHEGVLHVGMNVCALWMLGRLMEPMVGRWRFLAIYFVALLGGSAGALVVDAIEGQAPLTVGASGAIYGIFGAVAVALHRSGRSIFASAGSGRFQMGIGELLVINLLLTVMIPGISIGGHVGGLLAGSAIGFLVMDSRRTKVQQILATLGAMAVCIVIAIEAAGKIG